jgi:hypothetical protein
MPESSRTTEKIEGPPVRQFSIFLRNKVGALLDVVKMLNEHAVDVLALNVQDSADAAIVRIVVSDPEAVSDLFASHEIPCSTCDLVVSELKRGERVEQAADGAADGGGEYPRVLFAAEPAAREYGAGAARGG